MYEWHALFVLGGQEEKAKRLLEDKFKDSDSDVSFIVPKLVINERKQGVWREVLRKLLPGYILVHGKIGIEEYYMFKGVPGVVKLLRTGKDFCPIPEEEIRVLGTLMTEGDVIGHSVITFEEGDTVRVLEGPLKGLEGLIVRVDKRKGRARISLSFLGDQRFVDLSVKVLGK